uniref:Uncharacterized protein n=1 Tax=Rhizophora mucronata TaxID=61149 RepID=A0A2P2L7V1_RHIMU
MTFGSGLATCSKFGRLGFSRDGFAREMVLFFCCQVTRYMLLHCVVIGLRVDIICTSKFNDADLKSGTHVSARALALKPYQPVKC